MLSHGHSSVPEERKSSSVLLFFVFFNESFLFPSVTLSLPLWPLFSQKTKRKFDLFELCKDFRSVHFLIFGSQSYLLKSSVTNILIRIFLTSKTKLECKENKERGKTFTRNLFLTIFTNNLLKIRNSTNTQTWNSFLYSSSYLKNLGVFLKTPFLRKNPHRQVQPIVTDGHPNSIDSCDSTRIFCKESIYLLTFTTR